jgi:dTDP-glucose 4,6-dehydratase
MRVVSDMDNDVIVVTGGAGFIGSAVIRHLIREGGASVVNVDALTYAANPISLAEVDGHPRYRFEHVDIRSAADVDRIFSAYRPTAVLHLAAETHVDRSIADPLVFVQTNVLGTATLLQSACRYWRSLPPATRFRFHHVSTDEAFGSLGPAGFFSEDSPYHPNSPYAASKAGADHLVRAWHKTYGLPTIISNCSNNFGPYQCAEKFIPLMILCALKGQPMPIYGRGENVRDWLFVDDHARALSMILRGGKVGDCYNVGANNERRNIDMAGMICDLVDELAQPLPGCKPRRELMTFVVDRPGHDARYAIDARKIREELGWKPQEALESGLRRTVEWYLANEGVRTL